MQQQQQPQQQQHHQETQCTPEVSPSSSKAQNVSLSAINHETNWTLALKRIYNDDHFSDCVLVCPGGRVNAHRVILAASSEYFSSVLFKSKNCPVSTVFLNVNFYDLRAVIEFLYLGQVVVPIDCLPSLLDCARILMVTQMFNCKISYETTENEKTDRQKHCVIRKTGGRKKRKRSFKDDRRRKRSDHAKRCVCKSESSCEGKDDQVNTGSDTGNSSSHRRRRRSSSFESSDSSSCTHSLSSDECPSETDQAGQGLDLRVKDICRQLRRKKAVDLEPLEDGPKPSTVTTAAAVVVVDTGDECPEENCFKVYGDRLLDPVSSIKQEPSDVVQFNDDGCSSSLECSSHRLWSRANNYHTHHQMDDSHHLLSGLTVPLSGNPTTGSPYFWTEEETATLIRVWCEESERARESGHRHLNTLRLQASLQSHHIYRTIDQIRRKIYKLKYAFREFENDGKISSQISAHLKMLRTMDRQFILND